MFLEEGKKALEDLRGKKFGEIFNERQLEGIIRAKGKSGQILETAIGLKNTNYTLDFEDGELKTNKCNLESKPLETIFITQITSIIDDLINEKNFYETHLYKKFKNMLYVPVAKEGSPENWQFLKPIHVQLDTPMFESIKKQLEEDYYSICKQLVGHIETSEDGYIHTSNGKLIQIRSKDSKPYHPIYSKTYNKHISNKNHAFYFKKDFVVAIRNIIK